MALSREERIRRAINAARGTTTATTAPSRPRTTTQQRPYSPPAPGSVREPTLEERQRNAWGARLGRAIGNIEDKRPFTGGAAVIGGTAYVSRKLNKRHTGGRPYGVKGPTTGTEYVGRTRGLSGQAPAFQQIVMANQEKMPRSVRKVTTPARRAFRNANIGERATESIRGGIASTKREIARRRPVKRVTPVPAGSQMTNTRSLRSPTPATRPDRVGVAQRASQSVRGRGASPAVFGKVSQSPMRQPGMLNIPRAGKQLTKMVQASPEIPSLPQPGKTKAKPKSKTVSKPKSAVDMPKVPAVKSVPAPQKPAAAATAPSAPRGTGGKGSSPKPTAGYRPSQPKPVTEVKVKPPIAPEHARTSPSRGAQPKPKPEVVFEYEGRQKGEVIHRGGRSYEIKYGGKTFPLPYSPTAETAKEPRPPTRRSKAQPSKTFRAEAPGEQQWKAVFGELEKRGGMPKTLTKREVAAAQAVGVSESTALKEKQRAWATVDPVERNINKATGSRPPGPGVKAGARGIPNKSGRYAVKIAKAAGLMSGAGAALAVAEPLISPDKASAAASPKAKREAQRQFLSRVRGQGRALKQTQKYFGGVFR
jgi:hypothetical protein